MPMQRSRRFQSVPVARSRRCLLNAGLELAPGMKKTRICAAFLGFHRRSSAIHVATVTGKSSQLIDVRPALGFLCGCSQRAPERSPVLRHFAPAGRVQCRQLLDMRRFSQWSNLLLRAVFSLRTSLSRLGVLGIAGGAITQILWVCRILAEMGPLAFVA